MRKFFVLQMALWLILSLALVLASGRVAHAITFTWSGYPISGEAGVDGPTFFPAGSGTFVINGNVMTLTLTYTGASEQIVRINQVLTGLIWDLTNFTGTLTATSASIASGSSLVGVNPNNFSGTDLSSVWAYKDNIMAGGGLGQYGVGATGSINEPADSFGVDNIISPNPNLGFAAPDGVDFGLVGPEVNLNTGGLPTAGPYVQNSMVFGFSITGATLTEGMITNVQPIFGTEGMPPIPEPASILLLGSGLTGLGLLGWRRRQPGK